MEKPDELIKLSDPGEVGRAEHNTGDRVIVQISNFFAWLFPILMIAICSQVVLRSAGHNQAWLDDLQWWLYGAAVLIGIGYAVTTNSHVRVDIFYDNYRPAKKYRTEVFGLAWLFLPFVILCWDVTIHYAVSSVQANEGSDSPNGLHRLYLLKIFMNAAFIVVAYATWCAYVRFLSKLTKPVLWKKWLYAFPSVMFLVNLGVFYGAWWFLRLTSPAEVTDREISRHWFFDEFEVGPEELRYTVVAAFVLTLVLIGVARLLDRGPKEG